LSRFKVLLFEPIHDKGIHHLKDNGVEVVYAPGFEPAQIQSAVADVDGIIARAQGQIDAAAMDCAPNLKVVGRHGIGVDNIEIPAATERGIFVVNTPMAPVEAVAEYVVMAMVALPRKAIQSNRAVREGDWDFRNRAHGPELLGKTVGVVGFGNIGRRIAEICGLGFGMRVLYSDVAPAPPEEEQRLNAHRVDLDALLTDSDFVTLNVPLVEGTHHLVGADQLAKMRSGAILINCSRGPVVDEPALIEALDSGAIAGAVIDVFEEEPVAADNPLLAMDNVLLSPHCSGHSSESAENLSMAAADVIRVLNGERPEFPVNDPQNPRQPVA
jgi:D-3-phosphoglycerate dehydrogenase